MLSVTYAECHYAQCGYAECRDAECHMMLNVVMLSVEGPWEQVHQELTLVASEE